MSRPKGVRRQPLSARERMFIDAYVQFGVGSKAAEHAGYGKSWAKVAACRLLRREPVAREIDRLIKAKVRNLAPKAVNTVEEVMSDKSHKDRLRAARTILERSDPVLADVRNQTNVNVLLHQPSGDELGLKIMRHLRTIGADRDTMVKMLGPNTDLLRLEQQLAGEPVADVEPEPVIIDVQAEALGPEVVDEAELEDEDGEDGD